LNPALQAMTVVANELILGIIGIPAYIRGNFVEIPSGWFEIAGGCSGLHFFIVAVTLAVVYGHIYYVTTAPKFLLIVIATLMAMLINWIRVATIITVGHLTDMQNYLVQEDHYVFGWVIFVLALIPFFYFARRLETRSEQDASAAAAPSIGAQSKAMLAPLAVLCLVLLVNTLVWGRIAVHTGQAVEIALPSIDDVEGPYNYAGPWEPSFPGANGEAMGTYTVAGTSVDVYVNWFDGESQGRELIGYSADLAGKGLDSRFDGIPIDFVSEDGAKLRNFREIIAESRDDGKRLIQYYYLAGSDIEVRPLYAKLRQALRSMTGQFGSGLVSWSVHCERADEDCSAARLVMRSFDESFRHELHGLVADLQTKSRAYAQDREEQE
jgi:EpsI family protein